MAIADQAVIMAAGRGSRLQRPDPSVTLDPETEAIASKGLKALIPINGRPFLDHSVERLVRAGITRLCLIVGPEAEELKEYVHGLPGRFPGLHTEFVVQPEAKGSAHAISFARPATGDRDFLVMNSDNLYPLTSLQLLTSAPREACYAVGFERESLVRGSNIDESRIAAFGVLVPRKDDPERLEKVVEKPANPEQYLEAGKLFVTMNVWRFSPVIYDACAAVKPSSRGELELPQAVQDVISSGYPVKMLRCNDPVLDLTSRHDILTLRKLLE